MSTQKFDIKMCRSLGQAAEEVLVGRFPEGALGTDLASKQLAMGYLDEDITEDAEVPVGEKGTSEYYARRKKRRYKNKTMLAVEEQQGGKARAPGAVKLHGSLLDTKTEGGSAARYALFETVNRGGQVHVNMIPVDQWYSFKKPARAAAITLDDLEIAFDQKERQKSMANKKYAKVMQAMELKGRDFERKTGTGKEGEWTEGGSDIAFGAPLFGPEATKALSRSSQRSGENKTFKGYMDDAGGSMSRNEDNDAECGGNDGEADETFRDRGDDVDFDNTFSDDDNDAEALQKADEDREDAMGKEIDAAGEDSEDENYDDSGADSDGGDVGGTGLYESDALVRSAMEYNFLLKQKEQKVLDSSDAADASEGQAGMICF